MSMYQGNAHYCYANSASMLLATIGEDISPSLIEVLTGFALGAHLNEDQLLFFDRVHSSPDQGLNHAFEILGFHVQESVCGDNEPMPLDELKKNLAQSPVLLGPFDMGYLTYNPNYPHLGGADHYALALQINEKEILLHDPAGFPFVWLPLEQLDLAWKAEKITWSQGSYRCWVAPKRIANPTKEEIYEKAMQLFRSSYVEQQKYAQMEQFVGKRAILKKAEQIRNECLGEGEIAHFIYFAFPLGARRALDFSRFFRDRHESLQVQKETQARLLGQCHSLAMAKKWNHLAETLEIFAEVEEAVESSILGL